eukprot:7018550-Prymnesium_polylepis.1
MPGQNTRFPRQRKRTLTLYRALLGCSASNLYQLIRRWRRLQCCAFVHAKRKAHAKRAAD